MAWLKTTRTSKQLKSKQFLLSIFIFQTYNLNSMWVFSNCLLKFSFPIITVKVIDLWDSSLGKTLINAGSAEVRRPTSELVKMFSESRLDILTTSLIQLVASEMRSRLATVSGHRQMSFRNRLETSLTTFWKDLLVDRWQDSVKTKKTSALRLSRALRKMWERSISSSLIWFWFVDKISSKSTWNMSQLDCCSWDEDFLRKLLKIFLSFETRFSTGLLLLLSFRLVVEILVFWSDNNFLLKDLISCSDFMIRRSTYAKQSSNPSGSSRCDTVQPSETRNEFRSGWTDNEKFWKFWSGKWLFKLSLKTGIGGLFHNDVSTFDPESIKWNRV